MKHSPNVFLIKVKRVLGQLPPNPNSNANPKPNPNLGAIFHGGNCGSSKFYFAINTSQRKLYKA